MLALADNCRPTAAQTIQELRKEKIESIMLTEDAKGPATMIQKKTGIRKVMCSMAPMQKCDWIMGCF